MDLKTFINSLPDEAERKAFGLRCGSSIGHLRNIGYRQKTCSAELAVAIERESGGKVTRRDVYPNWRAVWPDLVDAEAPEHAEAA